ncbi:MAG: hypothetical protein PHW77_05955, partial [Eubacteriales bacterium]|nr:hypothetical protein [Eubacteriales bacterium]
CICAVFTLLSFNKKHRGAVLSVSLTAVVLSVVLCVYAGIYGNADKCRILYRDTKDGFSVYIANERDSLFIDYGGTALSEDFIFLAGNTACETLMIIRYDKLTYKKVEYFLACMSTDNVYLKKPFDDEEIIEYNKISVLAKAYGCDIIEFGTFCQRIGDVVVTVDNLSVCAEVYGRKAYISLSDDTDSFGINKTYDCIFLPSCVYEGSFIGVARTRYLLYGNKTVMGYAAKATGRIEYKYYDAVAVNITKNGYIEVE